MPLGLMALALVFLALASKDEANNGGQVLDYQGSSYTVFTANPAKHDITLHWNNRQGKPYSSIQNLLAWLKTQNKEVLMITNAGMYTPSHAPVGLYIENGEQHVPINTHDGSGNFSLKPNGVFYIDQAGPHVIETTKYGEGIFKNNTYFATQSGPMLAIDGQLHPAFKEGSSNLYIRSGVGIDSMGRAVFAISRQPVNFHTFASLFRDKLGCSNALYLDGAISLMYVPGISEQKGGNFGPIIAVTRK